MRRLGVLLLHTCRARGPAPFQVLRCRLAVLHHRVMTTSVFLCVPDVRLPLCPRHRLLDASERPLLECGQATGAIRLSCDLIVLTAPIRMIWSPHVLAVGVKHHQARHLPSMRGHATLEATHRQVGQLSPANRFRSWRGSYPVKSALACGSSASTAFSNPLARTPALHDDIKVTLVHNIDETLMSATSEHSKPGLTPMHHLIRQPSSEV